MNYHLKSKSKKFLFFFMLIFFSIERPFKKFLEIFLGSRKYKPKKKKLNDLKKIKLSRREAKKLLFLFNRINIFNIENENAFWTDLLNKHLEPMQAIHSHKIINAKRKFFSLSLLFESKLRKIMKLMNDDTSYAAKEKLLVSGLVYLELLFHNEEEYLSIFENDFNKISLKEYIEAKKFIRKISQNLPTLPQNPKKPQSTLNPDKLKQNPPNLITNINEELLKLFEKIAKRKREILKNKKSESNENLQEVNLSSTLKLKKLHSPTLSKNRFFDYDSKNQEENFHEYLKWKKYEIIEELVIFETPKDGYKKTDNLKKIPIENFIEDQEFKEFILERNPADFEDELTEKEKPQSMYFLNWFDIMKESCNIVKDLDFEIDIDEAESQEEMNDIYSDNSSSSEEGI